MRYSNEKELLQALSGRRESASQMRDELARQMGIDACYVEGIQFIRDRIIRQINAAASSVRPLTENYNADGQIRVVANETTKFIHKIASGTKPRRIEIDAMPPPGEASVEAGCKARAHEVMVQAVLDKAGYIKWARTANDRRTMMGQWGIGLGLRSAKRDLAMGGGKVEASDRVLYAYEFDPVDLILDPYERSRDLEDHPEVILETVWTAKKIREEFPGVEIDEDELQTVRELEPVKMRLNNLSEDRLYARYRTHSDAKAARVCQIHCKDGSGRHALMFIVVELPGGPKVVNFDDPQTPFGGCGMPLQLLYGHERPDAIWAISDTAMLRADQDKRNLAETLYFRILRKYGGSRVVVDRRGFAGKPTDEEIQDRFSNRAGEIVVYDGGDRQRPVNKPEILQTPEPPQTLLILSDRIREEMREKTHRPEGAFGRVKTHITSSAFNRSLDEAAEVMDARIREDVAAHERLVRVAQGTALMLIQSQSPSMAECLLRAGMEIGDIAPMMREDPYYPSIHITLRESTIRYRSHGEKKQDLQFAVANKLMAPSEYRRASAGTLEAALTVDDERIEQEALRAARNVLYGEEWQPLPLSAYNGEVMLSKFEIALFDPIAKRDPEAKARVMRAIQGQRAMMLLAQAESQGLGVEAPSEEPAAPEIGPAASPADALDQMQMSAA